MLHQSEVFPSHILNCYQHCYCHDLWWVSKMHSSLNYNWMGLAICYTNLKVTLYWIQGKNHEWKQFVGNWVASIRAVIPPSNWYHSPEKKNPADIPSRGMTPSELSQNPLWLNSLIWLKTLQQTTELLDPNIVMPKRCQQELKARSVTIHPIRSWLHTTVGKIFWAKQSQVMQCL